MSALCTIASTAALFISLSSAHAGEVSSRKLLVEQFDARPVVQVEIGDFHFAPGQLAPLHTHAAPVFGYVSKGSIFYQVEGQQPQLLKAGDAFYEPVGPNILHFDNASKTEEAIFTDLNFEREGEPFIVFPKPLTEKIDRRSFPSEKLDGRVVNSMRVEEETLPAGAALPLHDNKEVAFSYVAQGSVSVTVHGEAPIIYLAGQTFYMPKRAGDSKVSNASKTESAKLANFYLGNSVNNSR